METPLSARRITRSHALSVSNNTTIPISTNDQKGVSKSMEKSGKKQQDRSALFDITNDSPIVGLAMGKLSTPSSGFSKKRSVVSSQCSNNIIASPGSGEALLRSQVKSLLQKVEEEGEILKFSLEEDIGGGPFFHLKGLLANSPMTLLAPTPTNTPYLNGTQSGLVSGISTPVLEQVSITKMVTEIIERQNKKKEEECLITRSLLFDFYEKSEVSSNASVWSVEVNASSIGEEECDDEVKSDDYTREEEEEEIYDKNALDDLCEGVSKMSVNKHTRFVYDSDDDDEVAQEEDCGDNDSPLRLNGLPTPKGKHLRFHSED